MEGCTKLVSSQGKESSSFTTKDAAIRKSKASKRGGGVCKSKSKVFMVKCVFFIKPTILGKKLGVGAQVCYRMEYDMS
jgi:hypothetical protein